MTTTTPTGIPVLPCEQCGGRHPITRTHCSECGSAALFCHPGAPRVAAWQTFEPTPKTTKREQKPERGRMVRTSRDTWIYEEGSAA